MKRKDIHIACTSDWHLGNEDASMYPTGEAIQASLQEAFERSVDAFIVAGDFVDKGNVAMAHYAASIIRPFTEKGMPVIGVVGNHDFHDGSAAEVTQILAASGVKMLEGESIVVKNKTGDKSATILGVSGEVGPEFDSWWRDGNWSQDGRKNTYDAAQIHRDALKKGLQAATGEHVVVVTHRSIIPGTIGTEARSRNFVSAQTEGFETIIDAYHKPVTVVHGHDHAPVETLWEGFPEGMTKGGRAVYNVAAPLRMRYKKPLVKYLTIA